jgi:hypothetical protein
MHLGYHSKEGEWGMCFETIVGDDGKRVEVHAHMSRYGLQNTLVHDTNNSSQATRNADSCTGILRN